MPRVKRVMGHVKHRKNILAKTKGYRWGRKNLIKQAKVAVTKAGAHAFKDRRIKKRVNRSLWLLKINAAVREHGLTYSKFINLAKKNNLGLDRKILAQIAAENPEVFAKIVAGLKV